MKVLNYYFGNKKVSKSQKTKLVQNVFNDVTDKYDLMNDLMSFGTHRIWKKTLIELINLQNNQKLIDIGSGTGDIGLSIANINPSVKIFLGDLNLPMIIKSKSKITVHENNINRINLNAEELPFNDNYFDKYIISFCLRNITDINKALKESYRVLKKGAEFYCLEFSAVNLPLLNILYKQYKNKYIPLLGKYINNQQNAYSYLSESINRFPNQKTVKSMLEKTGFIKVSYYNLFNGIVSIHKGWKI